MDGIDLIQPILETRSDIDESVWTHDGKLLHEHGSLSWLI